MGRENSAHFCILIQKGSGYVPLLKLLKSRKFAVCLLTVITAVLLIGSFVPNPLLVSPAEAENIKNSPVANFLSKLNPMELSKTWFFYVLFSVLALTIIACTLDRLKYRQRLPKVGELVAEEVYSGGVDKAFLALEQVLKAKKWRVTVEEGEAEILAEKGRWGFWGSILFHSSILLLVFGGLLTTSGSFLAGIVVTEGQTLPLTKDSLVNIARIPRSFTQTGINVRLDTFRPELVNGTAVKYTAALAVSDKNGNENYKDVGINDSLTFKGYRFMLENYGFAPWLVIEDTKTGKVVIDAYINLAGRQPTEQDVIAIPDTDISMQTFIFPDFQSQGNKISNKSVLPNNPVYKLVYVKGNALGKEVLLPLNKEVQLENYKIQFKDLRYWTNIKIASDPGESPMFLGFILGCIGLSIRFLDPRKVLRFEIVKHETGKVLIRAGGYHSYAPNLFREKIAEILQEVTRGGNRNS
jgi:cytochrome c biogenesis protein